MAESASWQAAGRCVMRSYAARRYHRLRRRGLCGRCGRVKSKSAHCAACRQRAKELAAGALRGQNRCGLCLEVGHTRRTCTRPKPPPRAGYVSANEGYRSNRELGLCDNCGAPSPGRVYCAQCAERRKLIPSRSPDYLAAQRAKQDRTVECARRNARRRKLTRGAKP